MENKKTKVPNRLKKALLIKGITQRELARKLDVPPSHISKTCSGANISIKFAILICNELNLTLNDIFGQRKINIEKNI